MKVILHLQDESDMGEACSAVKYAQSEPGLDSAGMSFHSGKSAFFHRTKEGTLVVHMQPKRGATE